MGTRQTAQTMNFRPCHKLLARRFRLLYITSTAGFETVGQENFRKQRIQSTKLLRKPCSHEWRCHFSLDLTISWWKGYQNGEVSKGSNGFTYVVICRWHNWLSIARGLTVQFSVVIFILRISRSISLRKTNNGDATTFKRCPNKSRERVEEILRATIAHNLPQAQIRAELHSSHWR